MDEKTEPSKRIGDLVKKPDSKTDVSKLSNKGDSTPDRGKTPHTEPNSTQTRS